MTSALQLAFLPLMLFTSLTFQSVPISLRTSRMNIQNFYMVLAWRWVLCTDLR